MLERFSRLSDHGTDVTTEVLAGVTTFFAMSHIIFVQPAVLAGTIFGKTTGMDFGAVTTACFLFGIERALGGEYAVFRAGAARTRERRVGRVVEGGSLENY